MSAIAIVQARLSSTRFPYKVLAHLGGKPLIAHVVERAKAITRVQAVHVAVPASDAEALGWLAGEYGVLVSGTPMRDDAATGAPISWVDPADVLTRLVYASRSYLPEHLRIVRITADCPLFAPEIADELLRQMDLYGYDYATNDTRCSGFPDGTDVQIFTRQLLERAHLEASDPSDREHVCPWMERITTDAYRLTFARRLIPHDDERPVKLSVDTPEDLARVRAVYEALADKGDFSLMATMAAVKAAGVT